MLYYLLSDQLGSTTVTTDAQGGFGSELRYDAWGSVRYTNSTTPTDYTYTGQYSNVADFGLMYYSARWYDPTIARFIQADTIVPAGVQGYDRYAYANNAPTRYVDPGGHKPCWATKRYTCNLSSEDLQGLAHGSRSEQAFVATLLGYTDFEMEMLANLRNAGAEGIHAAEFIVDQGIHLVFKKLLWGGGGWQGDTNIITLQEDYESRGADDPFMVGLVAHEAYHLEQGAAYALSKIGEIEAWRLGFGVQRNFSRSSTGTDSLGSTAAAIADLELGKMYVDPQPAVDLIHQYNVEAKDPLYNMLFDLLPTRPLPWHWIQAGF